MSIQAISIRRVPHPSGCATCQSFEARYRTSRMVAGTWRTIKKVFATEIEAHRAAENRLAFYEFGDDSTVERGAGPLPVDTYIKGELALAFWHHNNARSGRVDPFDE